MVGAEEVLTAEYPHLEKEADIIAVKGCVFPPLLGLN
jgi:hypothetical protein